MSLVKTIKSVLRGFGHATTYVKREGVATAAGTVNITIPASGSFAPTLSNGMVRVKTVSIVSGGTVLIGKITGTDGTTTVTLKPADAAAGAANEKHDRVIPFCTDLDLTSITVTVIAATQDSVHDVEVAGNS